MWNALLMLLLQQLHASADASMSVIWLMAHMVKHKVEFQSQSQSRALLVRHSSYSKLRFDGAVVLFE
jgi:hypothetical protein